jgi:hypothetical protein
MNLPNVRRWVDSLLPDVEAAKLQLDWLRGIARGDRKFIAAIVQSPTARRLLNRRVYRQHRISVPGKVDLAPHQQWLLANHADQTALARRLGFDALQDNIRKTVRAAAVAAIKKELGDDGYKQALTNPSLAVTGLTQPTFDAAVNKGQIEQYAISVGAALLETTVPADDFSRLRMQFAFSPACWRMRPRSIKVDAAALAQKIAARVPDQAKS